MTSATTQLAAAQLGAAAPNLQQIAASASNSTDAIDAAAREFEAVMLATMLKPIFESVSISEPFDGGQGEAMWKGMLVEEYAKEMVASGGIGIADEVRAELLRAQEAASSLTGQ